MSKIPINPYFERKLPKIINDLARSVLDATPLLERADLRVRELHDYLDYEIQKRELAVERGEWETIVNPEALETEKRHLGLLKTLKEQYEPGKVLASSKLLNELQAKLQLHFVR